MERAVFIHGSLRLPSWEHRPARALGCSFVSARDPTALEYVRSTSYPKPAGLITHQYRACSSKTLLYVYRVVHKLVTVGDHRDDPAIDLAGPADSETAENRMYMYML